MEIPSRSPLLAPDPPDALQRILTPKALRFNTAPTKNQVKLLDYAIKHVFVPPRLPNRADGTPQLESALFSLVRDCAESFKDCLEPGSDASAAWKRICAMLAASMKLYDGELTEDSVKTAISSTTPGDVLVIYIAAQNAAIILRRPIIDPDVFTLESFEVTPPPKVVTHTEGKLRITYPSVGRVSAPATSSVYTSLAEFIAYYAQNVMADAKSQKIVKRESTEDPPSPRYITELLTGILRGMSPNPEQTFRQTTFFTKRINDHALCDKDADAPWRRSPVWLILRVTLQTTLHDSNLDERFSYKSFIIYALSSILRAALNFERPDYILFTMNAKLARRVWKLSHTNATRDGLFAIDTALDINTLVSDELEHRWKRIQSTTSRKIDWDVPTGQELMAATYMKPSKSIPYLTKMKKSAAAMQSHVGSKEWVVPGGKDYATRAGDSSGSHIDQNIPSTLDKMSPSQLERTIQLYDFELWVANKLQAIDLPQIDMIKLNKALNNYINASLTHYKGNPERLSVAFLTILELWVFIDRMVIDWVPKLEHYSPEIPVKVLEPLLLPYRSQMKRLAQVESYLEQRQHEGSGKSAIFYDTKDRESFVSWFVGQSASLRAKLHQMELEAERQTRQKETEMENMNAKYRTLKQEMDAAACTKQSAVRNNKVVTEHPSCTKCLRKKALKKLKFTVFERPLPAENIPRRCVVFELETPHQFAIWRDATCAVLSACSGGIKEKPDGKPWLISLYPSYKSHFRPPYKDCKLELASHRTKYDSTRKPPLARDVVIRPHSMSKYRVLNNGLWASNPFSLDPEAAFQYLRGRCSMEVTPSGPYKALQFSVLGTTHTSNQIIASQTACSTTITLHDHEAFGHLRAGHKLQWRNMLKELRRGVLSISHSDVHVLFLQAMWQAEAKSKKNAWRREAHLDAAEPTFGLEALEEMADLLGKIEDNWTWSYACGTLIAMAARVLSMTDEQDVQIGAIEFLKRARGVTHRWLKEITRAQERGVLDDKDMTNTPSAEASRQQQILLVALVCCSTFNVDESLICRVFEPARDISLLVECRSLIYTNKPPTLSSLPFALRTLFDRDQLLALRFFPRLANCLALPDARIGLLLALRFFPRLANCLALPDARIGLDEGIRATWDGYIPSRRWMVYNSPYERWYTTRTVEEDGRRGIDVHLNLLDGALYVDHVMFGKLPDTFTQHPTYLRLFSRFGVLETGPSTMPGMEYQTKRSVFGWQVHFAMRGKELVIQCQQDDQVFELIPDSKLTSALPRSLIRDYAHWYNTNTFVIDIRPLTDPWTPNLEENWSMAFQLNDALALSRQRKSGLRQFLVDPNHAISHAIHTIFAPLEPSVFDLLITVDYGASTEYQPQNLTISLPRYNLAFALTEKGDLECLSHRRYFVDPTQDVGTLYGLSNMLVLRCRSGAGHKRRLILPVGSIRPSSDGDTHPNVTIAIQSDTTSIKYHVYEIDDLLGRLRDTTLLGRLYRLYLHSLTSHQLVDPLLQRTGTQEALQGLAQGESFSFQTLLPEEITLLQEIGQLTPMRSLYSKQTNSLEIVQYNTTLPPTSEHCGFAAAVRKIWDYWMAIFVFHQHSHGPKDSNGDISFLPKYEEHAHKMLTSRSAVRNTFYAAMQSSNRDTTALLGKDDIYIAHDCLMVQGSIDREANVFDMSKVVHEWRQELDVTTRLSDTIRTWGQILARHPHSCLNYCSPWADESLVSTWRSLYELCRHADEDDQNRLAFVLATVAYHNPNQRQLCTTLLAFATRHTFRNPRYDSPDSGSLDFSYGEIPTESQLKSLITANTVSFKDSEEYAELLRTGWTKKREKVTQSWYQSRLREEVDTCMAEIIRLREKVRIAPSALAHFSLLRTSNLQRELNTLFKHCYQNRAFFKHLDCLQRELARIRSPTIAKHTFPWDQRFPLLPRKHRPLVTWSTLFQKPTFRADLRPTMRLPLPSSVAATSTTGSNLEQRYTTLLRASGVAYTEYLQRGESSTTVSMDFEAETANRTSALQEITNDIISSIGPRAEIERMLAKSGLWPQISPRSLLERLTISQRHLLSSSWKGKLLDYAQAIAMVQRARRISELSSQEHRAEYEREANNDGRSGWDSLDNPDWLLVELESNLLIRRVQAEVAREMLEPRSKQNTVMQLNMGEGKSSVIVPIVAAALADRSRLVRVVVLKPLVRQMFHLLCRTLGGLTNRRIFYLPVDRSLRPNPGLVKQIHELFVECMETGGILLCQPEHLLSFKLMALENLSRIPSSSLSQSFLYTQRWLEENARDILDESDEILSPKYQLVYTVGTQHAPDGDYMRWKVVQDVFELIRACASHETYGGSLSVDGSPPQFPQIRVFTHECGERLLHKVAEQIVFWDLTPSFSFRRFSREDRRILFRFITERAIDDAIYDRVIHICQHQDSPDDSIIKPILLFRGLIGHGVLLTILKDKRWRVDYGLDVSRSMLAVPYRAKDSPSPRAEFAHTDVAICLTCLTYYYEGLTDVQLEACFEQLFKADNPDQEYEEWIKDCYDDLPPTLHNLRSLNLEDPVQRIKHIFPPLRHCKAVIDFFLSTIVFPKHMKEFPYKLSTSGWDLAQDRSSFGQLVTGFSGTNDNRFLLPVTINQADMEAHLHTNAMVLHYLRQKENSKVIYLPGDATNVRGMFEVLRNEEPGARVLLDVGAQVLELQNKGIVELWLEVDSRPEIEAGVFVDSKDDLRVLRRDGTVELLVSSPYLEQLDRCVVYLDEAHTRGTDLKLPPGSRAAVTLGPRLCKDKLVQGCMRMRKLGSTHSIFFFASTEIIGYITAATGIVSANITSKDVIDWSIGETLAQLRTYASLWANQGFNFDDRNLAWESHKKGAMSTKDFIQILKEKESHTLDDLYRVRHVDRRHRQGNHAGLKQEIQERYEEFGLNRSDSARIQEEQEREVEQEKEEERQIERPPPATPGVHSLHTDVKSLVATGIIPRKSLAIVPAVSCLSQTTLGTFVKRSGRGAFPNIWVTNDFMRTIEKTHGKKAPSTLLDDFLRPVEWVLSSTKQPQLVLLSPFEANALIDDIRQSEIVTLHTYGARTSRMMRSFEDLLSFMVPYRDTLPPFPYKIINELNFFSGQLYFQSMDAYEETCKMLGLYLKELPEDLDGYSSMIGVTGFVRGSEARAALGLQEAQFSDNPVEFLRKFVGLRRKGQGFLPTHLGQVLHARELYEIDFA